MENLSFGLTTTALGMGLVFSLLILLWGLLALLGRFDRTQTEEREEEPAAPATAPAQAASGVDAETLAAITIALLTHTVARRRQAAPEMRSTQPGSQIYASRWLAAGRTRQTRTWQRRT